MSAEDVCWAKPLLTDGVLAAALFIFSVSFPLSALGESHAVPRLSMS